MKGEKDPDSNYVTGAEEVYSWDSSWKAQDGRRPSG